MFLEVEDNPNCESSVFLRFKELGPAKRVLKIKSYERHSGGEWCDVIGWTGDPTEPFCAAMVQPIEDSGSGLAYLVFGGLWGIRFKPESIQEDWNCESKQQWGESHLLLSDVTDFRLADG